MAGLKAAFEAMDCKNVRTVLASGNVVFDPPGRGPDLVRKLTDGLEKALGFPIVVITRTVRELERIIRSEPFAGVPHGPEDQLYVTFLGGKGSPRPGARLPDPPKETRVVRVDPGEIFSVVMLSRGGRTPDLMNYLDRNLGSAVTTRNWRTVLKLAGGGR